MNRIKAEIIADSINEYGQRISTFVLDFPRIVLAEFNTHRMLSRNSASSRAIPFKTMVEKVKNEPFIPIAWQKGHKGMQGNEYYEIDSHEHKVAKHVWEEAMDSAIRAAEMLDSQDITKQVCNRLLEPFLYHKCICTGTEWENFFALRANDQAEIHIQDLAYKMLDAYNKSEPKQLKAGEWHIPFGDKIDETRLFIAANAIEKQKGYQGYTPDHLPFTKEQYKTMIATARCARVSYLNFEGKDDYEADIKLHDILLKSGHMSPFEHCARAMSKNEFENYTQGLGYNDFGGTFTSNQTFDKDSRGWCGNFRGFIQYRKMLKDENKRDTRVLPRKE